MSEVKGTYMWMAGTGWSRHYRGYGTHERGLASEDTVTIEALQAAMHTHQGKKHQGEGHSQNLTEPPHPQSQEKSEEWKKS